MFFEGNWGGWGGGGDFSYFFLVSHQMWKKLNISGGGGGGGGGGVGVCFPLILRKMEIWGRWSA